MASSFSTDLKIELMVTGEKAGQWGDITNTNLNLVQQAIAGFESISIAGGAQTTTLVMTNGALSNARNAVIKLTGAITGNQVVTIPTAIEKTYIIQNGTTGAFTVEFKQAGGTGVTFAAADKSTKILFADGTNIVETGNTTPIITQINDTNVNEQIKFTTTASAVNEFTITNAATANAPEISATGGDTNIDLKLTPKGTGKLNLDGIKFPNADGSAGQFLKTDGSGVLSFAAAGLSWQSVQTTGFTAVKGNAYPCNTTSSAFTVTLPATPSAGDQVQLVDYAGTFDTNDLTINPNGEDIEGGASNLQLKGEREGVILTYIDSTQGWLATSGINEGTDALEPVTYSVDFLVVAGGGSGGYSSGSGGGAGGYRNSFSTETSGGGGSSEASLTLLVGNVYTVTVGAGGASATAPGKGNNGNNSSISGTGISTITSTAGGAGGGNSLGGNNGGSGGGAGGLGTANQGFNGAVPANSGGGGAGEVGNTDGAGFGGDGLSSSITGSSVARAGGGAGTGPPAVGGDGGGGAEGIAGTVNTGGGGGRWSGVGTSGAGGSGVVILSMPLANFSGTTTGSPTESDDGTTKRLVFNASGSYTG